jgi:hypothetical protein
MAKRKQPPEEDNLLEQTLWHFQKNFGLLGSVGWTKTSDHHPMFGCLNASSLLCSSGLPKCNGIKAFWVLANFVSRQKHKIPGSDSLKINLSGAADIGRPGILARYFLRKSAGNE